MCTPRTLSDGQANVLKQVIRKTYARKTVLILYGGLDETHELALVTSNNATVREGGEVRIQYRENYLIINWSVTPSRRIVQVGELLLYLLGNVSSEYVASLN